MYNTYDGIKNTRMLLLYTTTLIESPRNHIETVRMENILKVPTYYDGTAVLTVYYNLDNYIVQYHPFRNNQIFTVYTLSSHFNM